MSTVEKKMAVPVLERPTEEYDVPESARRWPTDPKRVLLRDLSVGEEIDAHRAAAATGIDAALTIELLRRSVVEVDGKPVDWADPSSPMWPERTSSKVRDLIGSVFLGMNRPTAAEVAAFLGSRRARAA